MHILGIRHHGTGSARRVVERLHEIMPDLILVEGPPEFDPLLKWVQHDMLQPPVAILGYDNDQPQQASFYPFATYSPEWQAILFANEHKIPVQMLDLPLQLSMEMAKSWIPRAQREVIKDPLQYLAEIEGFQQSESWWEHRFESNRSPIDAATYFEAVMRAMRALRDAGITSTLDIENQYREAWMRSIIRSAQSKMFDNIAIVCGAWHAPALLEVKKSEENDTRLLRQLPKSKISIGCTWVPWTNERLGIQSGYGAGVTTPGWSEHRWNYPQNTGAEWLSFVARAFRRKKIDISSAHVIEALRLAETLAALRQLPAPTLSEYQEAITTVMCMGEQIQLEWIKKQLVIGDKIGKVPEQLPQLPIQVDFNQHVKRLRLKLVAESKEIELDLRKPTDLERSIFLHRLSALQIKWGTMGEIEGAKGTFRENWVLCWQPELEIDVITKGTWGNSIEEAATSWLLHRTQSAMSISELTTLINHALPSALYAVNAILLQKLSDLAAISSDIFDLMSAVSPFARAIRYGNVRQTDQQVLSVLLEGIIARICIGFPNASHDLDEESAQQLFGLMEKMQQALILMENADWLTNWNQALNSIGTRTHPIIQGYAARLLLDAQINDARFTAQQLSLALSIGYEAIYSAAWLEGFLKGSANILLYDNTLWKILYQWTDQLPLADFEQLLPILRRTFSVYEPPERRRLGQKATQGLDLTEQGYTAISPDAKATQFDEQAAISAVTALMQIIGVPEITLDDQS